jgi:hypothetical protein
MPVLGFSSDFWIDFPSERDWERIYQHSPCSQFLAQLMLLLESLESGQDKGFFPSIGLDELVWQLHYREVDISKSFVLASYFFEKGIPDDEWLQSAEDSEKGFPFFPNFKEEHFIIKNWFDYYSDNFYYKLFSAWDTIAHILNSYFDLGLEVKRLHFPNAVLALKQINLELFEKLDNILNSPPYKKAKSLRNDVTHNYLPNSRGVVVTTKLSENKVMIDIRAREYITSKEIMKNISETLELFQETVKVIIER